MFLDGVIRRRLLSLLQPWVQEQPELDVSVGIIRSHAIAKNLHLDASALNNLLDCSRNFAFTEVTIDQLSLHFSSWSVPAFAIDVRGVGAVISARSEEWCTRRVHTSVDSASDDFKQMLSEIDPEGASLHDALGKLFGAITSRSRIEMSMLNLLYKHCRLGVHDVTVQLQLPMISDSIFCLLGIKEFHAVSREPDQGCIIRGLVSSVFIPLKKSFFTISCCHFEISLKRNGSISHVFSCEDLSIYAKLSNLHLVYLNIHVPVLSFSFCPVDLAFLVAFEKLLFKKLNHHRTGKQLWRLARKRTRKVTSVPILSLSRLVSSVTLWLRCVRVYEDLLLLVGYPNSDMMKRSGVRMCFERKFGVNVQQLLKEISDIEKELPPYATAQAIRVVRYKVSKEKFVKHDALTSFNYFYKIWQRTTTIVGFIWKSFYRVLKNTMDILFWKMLPLKQKSSESSHIDSDESGIRRYFALNINDVVITVWQRNQVLSPRQSQNSVSYSRFLSFRILIAALSLKYAGDMFDKSLFIYGGRVNVFSIPTLDPLSRSAASRCNLGHIKELHGGSPTNAEAITWSEPAQIFADLDTHEGKDANPALHGGSTYLQKFLQQMWLNWQKNQWKSEDSCMEYPENPFILCEISSHFAYPGFTDDLAGFCKVNVIVGKLNVALGHSSIASLALLIGQAQHALYWRGDHESTGFADHPVFTQCKPNVSWDGRQKSFSDKMKMALINMLPEKYVQLGAFINGPWIQVSFKRGSLAFDDDVVNPRLSQNQLYLTFDIHDIEFALWPTPQSDALTKCEEHREAEPVCAMRIEPQSLNLSKVEERNVSHLFLSHHLFFRAIGLNLSFDDMVEKRQSKILCLHPVTFHLSSTGEYFHSLGRTDVALSVAFCGTATGFVALFYLDELYFLSQVVRDLFAAISRASCTASADSPLQELQVLTRQDGVAYSPLFSLSSRKGSVFEDKSVLYILRSTFRCNSIDLVFQKSRTCENMDSYVTNFDAKMVDKLSTSNSGMWIFSKQIFLETCCEEANVEVLIHISGVQFAIFKHDGQIGTSIDISELRNVVLGSFNCLYELHILSLLCTLWWASSCQGIVSHELSSTYGEGGLTTSQNLLVPAESKRSRLLSHSLIHRLESSLLTFEPVLGQWLLINSEIVEIAIGKSSMKDVFLGAHETERILFSLSIGGDLRRISCKIQGGLVLVETMAFAEFLSHYASFCHHVEILFHALQPYDNQMGENKQDGHIISLNDNLVNNAEVTLCSSSQARLELVEAFCFDMSQFSIVLAVEKESGIIQELVIEVDVALNLVKENKMKQFVFDFSRLSIISQVLHQNVNREVHVLHFPTLSSEVSIGNPTMTYGVEDGIDLFDKASSSKDLASSSHSFTDVSSLASLNSRDKKFIVKHFVASVHMEKPSCDSMDLYNAWAGHGSISGCDMTISLSEIQIILSIAGSLPAVFSKGTTTKLVWRDLSNQLEIDRTFEEIVPNGAVVAIQDIDQHMYFTVEGGRDKYQLVGSIHYSLVGEQALFRVHYHRQRGWRSSVLWFSLASLHAKDESGKPAQLAYRQGSGFVEVSSSHDGSCALWRAVCCKSNKSKGDIEKEPYNQLVKDAFYLINKKKDGAVAFVNGVPEFVMKPGNPFKFKVLHISERADDHAISDIGTMGGSGRDLHDKEPVVEEKPWQGKLIPQIDIKVENVSMTIIHDLLGAKDTFPVLRGRIYSTQLIVQILPVKVRIICMFTACVDYFDTQRNTWVEFLQPVGICLYYRCRLQIPGAESLEQGVPISLYCNINEVDLSLSEILLDIILFVIGELNIGGPYSVRSAMIQSNLCKVENQTGSNLLCQLYGSQSLKIYGKQSVCVYLRGHDDQPQDAAIISVQLASHGSYATSPIHLSLLEAQAVAWRTRIVSLQDSRSYPGPFAVVDIVRSIEDGLSLVISPLVRIHNKTDFPMELQFKRPELETDESVFFLLRKEETFDDAKAMFDAVNLSGGSKRAITSLGVGNFLFSFRPEGLHNVEGSPSVEWSDNIKGGKAVHLSGVLDKLSFRVHRAFSHGSVEYSSTTACCAVKWSNSNVTKLHFLIQSYRRSVPIRKPNELKDGTYGSSHVTLQEQREIFLLPTVRVSNLLHTDIHVLLTDKDTGRLSSFGNQATVPCGSAVNFYVDPSVIYFNITMQAFDMHCKPLNSSDWVKRLFKKKTDTRFLDIDVHFEDGKYAASMRLSRGPQGILEATIFTPYSLKNETDFSLFVCGPKKKILDWDKARKVGFKISPDVGLILPPKSRDSWYSKTTKLWVTLLDLHSCNAHLDLDALSGLSEVRLEMEDGNKVKSLTKIGVVVGPASSNVDVPAQLITLVPRYVVCNDSREDIIVRQCSLEDAMAGHVLVKSKQRAALQLRCGISERTEFTLFGNIIRKHRNSSEDSMIFIQFHLNDPEYGWSGPICVASLGCFFVKFRRQTDQVAAISFTPQFANVHVSEEGSSLILQFSKPPNMKVPYRIENHLHDSLLTYYQKESSEPEVLQPGSSVDYVWDDLTLPRRLVVHINDEHLLCEINLDKVQDWKPFVQVRRYEKLASQLLVGKKSQDDRSKYRGYKDMVKFGYEVYADGPTRVLRVCEVSNSRKGDTQFHSCEKIHIRVPSFVLHMLDTKDGDESGAYVHTPILNLRLACISIDTVYSDQSRYIQTTIESLDVEPKWSGAPFAAILRRHHLEFHDSNDCILKLVLVLHSSISTVKEVRYFSMMLQPIDLNLDEETLMRIAPFWRSSLSKSPSQQYYFDHFEIHPIKITANFLPGDSYLGYSTAQETLRSLIHSVVKVPPMKNVVVELNGVLVTHALITVRELYLRCAQHYSWYVMRAIYIAKGSPLLPPGFASIFDDLASSSLDIFFDPSHGLMKLPGFTSDTFRLIGESIAGKGFSGTRRYFGDLGKTLRTAGSNILFTAVTEVSDSVLRGAETNGIDGMIKGFHQGILNLAMEPSVLGSALMEGGPDRTIKLDQSPGIDELYIEGYLQAMLDSIYKQEYLRVRVIDNQVILKNLPPSSKLIDEIMDRVKGFLISKALLKGDPSTTTRPLRHLRGESEWKVGPTVMTLCEHLFVSFAIRVLKSQASKYISNIRQKKSKQDNHSDLPSVRSEEQPTVGLTWRWGIGKFVLSGIVAYIDGRLCRCIPNPIARRIVSGFLLSFLDKDDTKSDG